MGAKRPMRKYKKTDNVMSKESLLKIEKNNEPLVFDKFCENKKCEQYHEWETGVGSCVSCRLVGQSYNIMEYPLDCLFIDEIKEYENLYNQPKEMQTKRFQLYRKLRNGTEFHVTSCEALDYNHAKQIFREQNMLEFDFDKKYTIEEGIPTLMEKFMKENGLGPEDMVNDI